MKKQKVLIIKLGYSETLDPEIGRVPSLGDVMRTTVILHCFKSGYHVTWLTDESAYPLLKGNPYIDRILFFNLTTTLQLQAERFDKVVNLEKVPGLCALADSINAWSKYGFRFDPDAGEARSYEGSHDAFKVYTDINKKRNAKRVWQDVLFEMLGKRWRGENYILGYKPVSRIKYQIGLNYLVGTKWPNKVWPKQNWDELQALLEADGYAVSLQQGRNNIEAYLEWINSCGVLVTHDSLGLHIAIALQKRIVALFGPTSAKETALYSTGVAITPQGEFNCLPCLKPECDKAQCCMHTIPVETVYSEVVNALNGKQTEVA